MDLNVYLLSKIDELQRINVQQSNELYYSSRAGPNLNSNSNHSFSRNTFQHNPNSFVHTPSMSHANLQSHSMRKPSRPHSTYQIEGLLKGNSFLK